MPVNIFLGCCWLIRSKNILAGKFQNLPTILMSTSGKMKKENERNIPPAVTGLLKIINVSSSDEGSYTCFAFNKLGKDTSAIFLKVYSKRFNFLL